MLDAELPREEGQHIGAFLHAHAGRLAHTVAGTPRLREQVGLKRLFLHAASLEFALEGGKTPYVLNAPLAGDLAAALDRLG